MFGALRRHFTAWSLAALAVGLGLGLLLHGSAAPWVAGAAEALRAIGRTWIITLQLLVVPLVVSQVVVALLGTRHLGRLGLRTLVVFTLMLLATAAIALLLTPPLLALYPVERDTVARLVEGIAGPEPAATTGGRPVVEFLRRFFLGQYLIEVLLAASAFALLARAAPGALRARISRSFEWLAALMRGVVGLLLLLAPVGIVALSFGLARTAGGASFGLLLFFVLLTCGVALLLTLLLYPVTAALGGVPIARFAAAAAPAQLVGLSTRSSLAALPAMVTAAERLGLPPGAPGFVLPFAMATVKISRSMSAPVVLLFLSNALGTPLPAQTLLAFMGGVLLLSFVVPGLPGRGPEAPLLPLYAAAGIPLGGVLLLEAVDTVPDMFKTALNVTSILSAAAIVTRPDADPERAA